MIRRIDLNADMGESFGAWSMGADAELVTAVTSANVACGFHAGDPRVMAATVRLCRDHGVNLGAHPGFPDLNGFGRRMMEVEAGAAHEWTLYQLGALDAFARARGARVRHVKPHGALYNLAAVDERVSREIATAVKDYDPGLILLCLAGSATERVGREIGLTVAREAFLDRAYLKDGTLAPRRRAGSMILGAENVARRAVSMCRVGRVATLDGAEIEVNADSFCVHGDSPGAAELARAVRRALEEAEVEVLPLPRVVGIS